MVAYLGDVDKEFTDPGAVTVGVEHYWWHGGYNATTNANDIMLVRLRTDVIYTDNIGPLCLPQSARRLVDTATCMETGWGREQSPIQCCQRLELLVIVAGVVALLL